MSIIELPALASSKEQIKYVVNLLNKYIPENHKKGIQIYRGGINRDKQSSNNFIESTIKKDIPNDFIINLHAPFIVTNPNPEYNFTSDQVKPMILENISLAESINADSLIIHLNSIFYNPERLIDNSNLKNYFELFKWKNEWNNYNIAKKEIINIAYNLLKDISKKTKIKLSIENLVIPLLGGTTTNIKNLLYDPKLNTYESIIEFLNEFSDFKNVGLCFDVAHYKITQMTINNLIQKHKKTLTQDILKKEGFFGLYPERFSLQPSIKEVVKELVSRKILFDLQIADTGPIWIKNSKLLEEGLPIKNNDSGRELLDVAKYVAENSPDTPISFDIEEHDYLHRTNQINALKLFLKYINAKSL
jgi:hypothetical protein